MNTASICLPGSRLPTWSRTIERPCAVDRRGDQRFLEGHLHREAGERHGERHRRREAAAGVDVGRERDRHARRDQLRAPARSVRASGRTPHSAAASRSTPARRHRRDPVGGNEDQVIGRARADARGDQRSAARGRARRHGFAAAVPRARPASRIRVDSAGVNTPVSQKTSHHSASRSAATAGNHFVDDEVDVRVAPRAELDRHLVRAHERRDDVDGCRRERGDRAQHLQLGLDASGRSRS